MQYNTDRLALAVISYWPSVPNLAHGPEFNTMRFSAGADSRCPNLATGTCADKATAMRSL